MQVNVKYEYTELYLPTPRCRKYRSRDAKKSCEAKVKEVKASELDSVESCVMRSAFEMMDNTFNLESPIATITDSGIKVFPNSDDIEKIIENPANWVVVPLLFKECDD